MNPAVPPLIGLLMVLAQSPSPPQAELVWIRDVKAVGCEEAALRQAVAKRLGYDPFIPSAPMRVVVDLLKQQRQRLRSLDQELRSEVLRGRRRDPSR